MKSISVTELYEAIKMRGGVKNYGGNGLAESTISF